MSGFICRRLMARRPLASHICWTRRVISELELEA